MAKINCLAVISLMVAYSCAHPSGGIGNRRLSNKIDSDPFFSGRRGGDSFFEQNGERFADKFQQDEGLRFSDKFANKFGESGDAQLKAASDFGARSALRDKEAQETVIDVGEKNAVDIELDSSKGSSVKFAFQQDDHDDNRLRIKQASNNHFKAGDRSGKDLQVGEEVVSRDAINGKVSNERRQDTASQTDFESRNSVGRDIFSEVFGESGFEGF